MMACDGGFKVDIAPLEVGTEEVVLKVWRNGEGEPPIVFRGWEAVAIKNAATSFSRGISSRCPLCDGRSVFKYNLDDTEVRAIGCDMCGMYMTRRDDELALDLMNRWSNRGGW